jgi:sialic acid synthase SpsE
MTKIIAEFCQNHNGDMSILKDMVWSAAENGATHGKIQTIFVEDLANREGFDEGVVDDNGKQVRIKRPYQAEYDRLKKLELSYKQHEEFMAECEKAKLIPLTTCFSNRRIKEIRDLGFKYIKVASYDCGSFPLIEGLAETYDEIIVSTGATYNEEIEKTAGILKNSGKDYSLLHCVTIYPTPLNEIHLNRLNYLKTFTPNVGLSEHTDSDKDGVKASIGALYFGANILERHFTVLERTESRDGPVSINGAQLKELYDFSKMSKDDQLEYVKEKLPEYEVMLGNSERALSDTELLNRDYYRGRFASIENGKTTFNWE